MTPSDPLLGKARALGESAGRGFLETGVWPRCPFHGASDLHKQLALAWTGGVLSVTGPGLAPDAPSPGSSS